MEGPPRICAGNPGGAYALAVKPDGKQAAAATAKSVKLWDLAAGTPVKDLEGHAAEVESAAWRLDGGQIASGDKARIDPALERRRRGPQGVIENPRRHRARPRLPPQQRAARLGGIRRPGTALASCRWLNTKVVDLTASNTASAFAPMGRYAAAGPDKVVRVYNTADGTLVKEIPASEEPIAAPRLEGGWQPGRHRPGQSASSGSATPPMPPRSRRASPPPPSLPSRSGPTARTLAVASEDKLIRVLDAAAATVVKELAGHGAAVNAARIRPQRR